MAGHCWLNGEVVATLPATDRGLHYGDGLFETIRVENNQPVWWLQHLERLLKGCRCLSIVIESGVVEQELKAFITSQIASHGIVKLMVTRGSGGRGYNSTGANHPNRLLLWYPLPKYPVSYFLQGIKLYDCQTRLGQQPVLAGLKHLNRLEQILARQEWTDNQFAEGLMLDLNQHIVEGTMTNIFWVAESEVQTPALTYSGVAGVCRQFVLEQAAQLGLTVKPGEYKVAALARAKEVFVCNSVIGVWPVTGYRHWNWPVGKLTQQLQALINAVMPCERLFSEH
ncbi:aminodeoxychorismate lyase [Spartinivicinus ruber]|uniref:aminodeoxychorismate lyase n=1 Tax=Spartinivicinus ruber TaxID=2683272 RepID=UPI0013D37E5B|nr:aminodeoxychorismate lyase [Spartinivicinus ruber]